METNTRDFLRNVTSIKAGAQEGKAIREQKKKVGHCSSAAAPRKSLLGSAKGKISFHSDLTRPTLPNESGMPSLC